MSLQPTQSLLTGIKQTGIMRFQPGQSGNPRGRPKSDFAIAELCRPHTKAAVAALVSIMGDKRAPPAARVSAAGHLLDRGWGKPAQTITGANGGPLISSFAQILASIDGSKTERFEEPAGFGRRNQNAGWPAKNEEAD